MVIPDALFEYLSDHVPLAVAVSGGTDSMTLLASCLDAGIDATGVFVRTGLNPAGEEERVSGICRRIGAEYIVLNCDLLGLDEVRHNSPEKCYACKHTIFSAIFSAAAEAGIRHVADGTNADDIGTARPGLRALRELGVISPFAECGIGRTGVERIASALGIGVMPQSSCLATRFPVGTKLDPAMVEIVRCGEVILRSAGVDGILRLRCADGRGVVECEDSYHKTASGCVESLLELGFDSIVISPEGYREGGGESWRL